MKLRKILNENKIIAYHGSKTDFESFDLNRVGKGIDQNGPGFYFTQDIDDAKGYGDRVYEYELNLRKTVPTKGKINIAEIQKLMKLSSNLNDVLMNWGENKNVAFREALSAMIDAETPFHAFTNVWYDFYRDHPKQYVENMIKLGYDGVIIKGSEGYGNISTTHIIVFNPNSIKKIRRI